MVDYHSIESALSRYASEQKGMGCVPELVNAINRIRDLGEYTKRLSQQQLEGKEQIVHAYQYPICPKDNGCDLRLFWNPSNKILDLDWDDSRR